MWQSILSSALKTRPKLPAIDSKNIAATLLLLSPKESGKSFDIVLTKRTRKVDTHKGQISLPGGFREPVDLSWEATALREAHEEIGISQNCIQVLGALNPVLTGAQVSIIPFVGLQTTTVSYRVNPDEVDKILLLPSEALLHQGLKPVVALEGKFKIESVGICWDNELIWGATARILEQLYSLLRED